MWLTILAMALAVNLEPFRIGMTLLMLNRPRPKLQLLVFLCGGFTMGVAVGLIVLFAFQQPFLGSLHVSQHLTLPRAQILIGLVALVVAAGVAGSGLRGPRPPARALKLMNGRSLWVAGAAGLGIALPSVDYLAALAVIVASGTTAMTQVAALLTFNVVAFALVEIPLAAYLLTPDRTRSWMTVLHNWIRARRRGEVAGLLAGAGCVLLVVGVTGL